MMRRKESNHLLDRCIQTDLKIIEKDLELTLLLWTAMFAMGLSWGLLFLAVPMGIGVLTGLYHIFKKLYGKTVFGADAPFFQSLPVPTPVFLLSKIFTGGLIFLVMGMIFCICLVFQSLLNGMPDGVIAKFEGWIYGFVTAGIAPDWVPLAAVLTFLNLAAGCFTLAALIFTMMCGYYCLPCGARGYIVNYLALYVGTFVIMTYLLGPWVLKELELLQPAMVHPVFCLLLSIGLTAGSWKVCMGILSKQIGGA